jgi:hypothetical protein
MKARTLTVRDYVRAFSRLMTPVANTLTAAMSVGQYMSGREPQPADSQTMTPGRTRHPPRRPWQQWAQDNTWGHDTESDRFEREIWMEGTFFNDADMGVTYGETTWDGQWNEAEAWRR